MISSSPASPSRRTPSDAYSRRGRPPPRARDERAGLLGRVACSPARLSGLGRAQRIRPRSTASSRTSTLSRQYDLEEPPFEGEVSKGAFDPRRSSSARTPGPGINGTSPSSAAGDPLTGTRTIFAKLDLSRRAPRLRRAGLHDAALPASCHDRRGHARAVKTRRSVPPMSAASPVRSLRAIGAESRSSGAPRTSRPPALAPRSRAEIDLVSRSMRRRCQTHVRSVSGVRNDTARSPARGEVVRMSRTTSDVRSALRPSMRR
jgi:hypothetical protein